MSASRHAELTTAFFMYVVRCAEEKDEDALAAMNIGSAELEALRRLDLGEIAGLSRFSAPCVEARLNRRLYWAMLERVHSDIEDESLKIALMKAHAPVELMRCHFGMSRREYARIRKGLALPSLRGRPPLVDEDLEYSLWQHWRSHCNGEGDLSAHTYLEIHQATAVPIRAIWNLVHQWQREQKASTAEDQQHRSRLQ